MEQVIVRNYFFNFLVMALYSTRIKWKWDNILNHKWQIRNALLFLLIYIYISMYIYIIFNFFFFEDTEDIWGISSGWFFATWIIYRYFCCSWLTCQRHAKHCRNRKKYFFFSNGVGLRQNYLMHKSQITFNL